MAEIPPRNPMPAAKKICATSRVSHGFRLGVALFALFLATAGAWAGERIVVASKIDTEGALLGQIIAQLLHRNGFEIDNRIQLGPTNIVREAIRAGQIDIYPEYTGNGASFFHLESDPVWKDARLGYERVKSLDLQRNKLVWLDPAPVSNTWAIVVNPRFANDANVHTLDDFSRYVHSGAKIRLAASAEFVESPTALPAFQSTYGFDLHDDQLLVLAGGDTAATNRIAAERISSIDAAMAYTTDGAIRTLGLVLLADPRGAQTVYEPCPVVREAVFERAPQIRTILAPAFAALTLPTLQALNARIAVDGEDAAEVAKSYLTAQGLLP